MTYTSLFARGVMACLLLACLLGTPPVISPASAGQSGAKARESRSYVLESRRYAHRRARAPRIWLPVGPAYIYYDYPYYYARGHYPKHIGGYVYYIPRSGGGCTERSRKCVAKAGYHRAASWRQRRACGCR
ncbi:MULTISPECIES: hypothetical protein [Hyphomicrobium]|jgi:hypothetical protein|uniref:hypothetical protein n=1 Tax=Hyphomicrobium TaxID=81 RepID=UPI0003816715|nr:MULTISPECIES: hypothetical protein [Hyphomicrobium]WBT36930.1 hypothetical protein PE058_14855 [Hyphomicrobium sp. DMF-1]